MQQTLCYPCNMNGVVHWKAIIALAPVTLQLPKHIYIWEREREIDYDRFFLKYNPLGDLMVML